MEKMAEEIKRENNGLMVNNTKFNQKEALKFLHQMDYNLVRAKFFVLFPSFWHFRGTKWTNQMELTDEIMELKTKRFL